MGYLDNLYDKLCWTPVPNNNTILKSAYHIASIAHDLRVIIWMEKVDRFHVQNLVTMGIYRLDKQKEYALILSRYPNMRDLPILNDSLTYLKDVLEELKIEFELDKGFD